MLITLVVLAETVWTLAGRRNRANRADLIDLVNNLLHDANLRFEDEEVVCSNLQAFRKTKVDIATTLIVCKALKTAADGYELSVFCTFNDAVLQLSGATDP